MSTPPSLRGRPARNRLRDLNTRTGTQYAHPLTLESAGFELDRLNNLRELQDLAVPRFTRALEHPGLSTSDEIERAGQQIRYGWHERKAIAVVALASRTETSPGLLQPTV